MAEAGGKVASISTGVEESVATISEINTNISAVAEQAKSLEKLLGRFRT